MTGPENFDLSLFLIIFSIGHLKFHQGNDENYLAFQSSENLRPSAKEERNVETRLSKTASKVMINCTFSHFRVEICISLTSLFRVYFSSCRILSLTSASTEVRER